MLGLNDAAAARRLVRLLLADPLVPRGDWEDILNSYDADTSRGLLIRYSTPFFFVGYTRFVYVYLLTRDRYGEVSKTIHNDLLPTISVPSSVLKNGNLEILVSSLGADAVPPGVQVTADTFLVPIVPIRTSHSGRHNFVRYPVHRTLVCGSGVDGLLAYSGLVSRSATREDGKLVYGAIELPVENKDAHSDDRIAFVDLEEAVTGLDRFRESVKNAPDYERGWNKSGVQRTLDWLSSLRSTGGKLLDPTLERLIGSLIDAAEEGVRVQEVERVAESEALSVSDEVRTGLDQAVSTWAERGHTELRHSLDEGFSSRTWRELRWWKLFWHVDDVTMLASDILERNYLRQAEKELIWTSGKLQQAGLLSEPQEFTNNNITDEPVTVVSENTEELAKVNNNKGDGEIVAMTVPPPQQQQQQQPWPSQISESRNRLLNTFGPSLQAVAQRLVLFSISTTTLTSALSALTYISVPTASIYESCTVAAVGIAYSLRRQQKRWDSARASWESDVREDGRMSLRETEGILKAVVREGGKVEAGESDGRVREAIDGARRALEAAK